MAAHDFIGAYEFTLHEVVTAHDQTLSKDLICSDRPTGKSGRIKITADERSGGNNEELSYRLSGTFPSNDGMNFFMVYKFISPQVYKPVYKSEIMASLNGAFMWKPCSILTSELANEDPEREIRVEFFKSQKSGLNKNLGYISLNLGQLKEGTRDFPLLRTNGKPTEYQITFEVADFDQRHSFLEYVFGGCQIQLAIAVDFTLSNGHPSNRDSLHCADMNKNEYLQAIRQVGNIIQYYDSDK